MKILYIEVEDNLYNKIEEEKEKHGSSQKFIVIKALEKYFEERENETL